MCDLCFKVRDKNIRTTSMTLYIRNLGFYGSVNNNNNAALMFHSSFSIKLIRHYLKFTANDFTRPAFTCSMLIIETLEQDVKYVQS